MAALALAPASADVVLVVQEERVRICASRCFRWPPELSRRRGLLSMNGVCIAVCARALRPQRLTGTAETCVLSLPLWCPSLAAGSHSPRSFLLCFGLIREGEASSRVEEESAEIS